MNELITKALGLQANGFNAEAMSIFQKALTKEPNNVILNEYYGCALLSFGHHKEAKIHLTKALANSIEKPQVLNNLSTANRALGLFEEGLLNAKSAIKFRPSYIDAWINRANLHSDLKQWPQAISSFENAIKLDRDDQGPYLSLARVYLLANQIDDALNIYSKYYPRFKDIGFLIGELICYRAKKDFITAVDFAKKLKNEYNNELMWFEWVQTLWLAGETEMVQTESDKAIALFGEYPALMSIVRLLDN